jgi:hypothetical protein
MFVYPIEIYTAMIIPVCCIAKLFYTYFLDKTNLPL